MDGCRHTEDFEKLQSHKHYFAGLKPLPLNLKLELQLFARILIVLKYDEYE